MGVLRETLPSTQPLLIYTMTKATTHPPSISVHRKSTTPYQPCSVDSSTTLRETMHILRMLPCSLIFLTPLEIATGIGSSTDKTVSTVHTGVVKAATITDSVKFQRIIHGLK